MKKIILLIILLFTGFLSKAQFNTFLFGNTIIMRESGYLSHFPFPGDMAYAGYGRLNGIYLYKTYVYECTWSNTDPEDSLNTIYLINAAPSFIAWKLIDSSATYATPSDTLDWMGTKTDIVAKFDIPTGNNTQYLDGAGIPTTFPTIPTNTNQLSNGAGFITGINSSMITTALTYIPVPNTRQVNGHVLSTDVTVTKGDVSLGNADNTSDAAKPVSTATQTALNLKQDGIILTTTGSSGAASLVGPTLNIPQYANSGGTVTSVGITSSDLTISNSPVTTSGNITANLNTTGVSAGNYGVLTVDTKGRASAGKRQEIYSGTTNSSGVYTVTFGAAYSVAPNIQANITNQSNVNQYLRVTSVSTTGFTINVFERAVTSLLGIDLISGTPTNSNGVGVDVIVNEK